MGFQTASGAYIPAQSSSAFQLGGGEYFANIGADTVAPVLTSPGSSGSPTDTTHTAQVTTDEGNGTLYVVASTSATPPSAAQVKLGQNHLSAAVPNGSVAISSTGVKTKQLTTLTHTTTYYWHFMHEDSTGNQSAVVSSSSFTTLVPQVDVTDVNTTEVVVENATITWTGTAFGASQGAGLAQLVSGAYTDNISVATWGATSGTGTIAQPSTSAVPFTDANNSVSFKLTGDGNGNDTLAITYNPPSGQTAYKLSAATTDTTEYSVLASAGVANGDQLVAPTTYDDGTEDGGTITWETSSSNATGRYTLTGEPVGRFTIRYWRATTGQVFTSTIVIGRTNNTNGVLSIGRLMNR